MALLRLLCVWLLLCPFHAAPVAAVDCGFIVIDSSNEANVTTLFGDCTGAGSLYVNTTQLQNLDALASLTRVDRELYITGSNARLTNVSLPQLVSAKSFQMTAAAVTSLTVAALETVGSFIISDSPALISVQLPMLRNGWITITTCSALTSLHMPSLNSTGRIVLEALPSLSTDVDFASLRLLPYLALEGALPFLDQNPHAFASLQELGELLIRATGVTSMLLGGIGNNLLQHVSITMVITAVTDLNCNLCLNFNAVTPSVLPYSGGVVVTIPYTGVTPYDAVRIGVRTSADSPIPSTPCVVEQSVSEGQLRCIVPALVDMGNQSSSEHVCYFVVPLSKLSVGTCRSKRDIPPLRTMGTPARRQQCPSSQRDEQHPRDRCSRYPRAIH